MSTIKIKAVIRLDKLSHSTNEAPVCLRITKDRKTIYKTLLHINPRCWDAKAQRIIHHKNADVLNAVITNRKAQIEREIYLMILQNDDVNISTIRNRIHNASSDFFEYANRYCESIKENSFLTHLRIKSIIRKLHLFHQGRELPIRQIDAEFVRRYEHHLSHEVGNSRNTIAISMRFIATIVRSMYKEHGLNDSTNPFKTIHYQFEPATRQYLLAEEVTRIQRLPLTPESPIYHAREVFIFECYTGLRISDILTLKWENISDEAIALRMRKTDKLLSIPLQNDIKHILARRRALAMQGQERDISHDFVFSYLQHLSPITADDQTTSRAICSATAAINIHLKTIAKLSGIDKNLSTHVARHTFATLLLTNGNDLPVIQDLLGHHDVRITQIYAKVISTRKTEAINSLNRE
jgi:site-specific recombinase XerD